MSVSFQILMAVFMLSVKTRWAVLCVSVILDLCLMVKTTALVLNFKDVAIHNSLAFHVTDVDECAASTDNNCDINADCTNTEGSFTCVCHHLYYSNGISCESKLLS